ncbi:MAG: SDR family NAD(P)-dependent oxidoreductase [Pirellulaceae bacterium]|nr:SDR family NAD(P)-dependent oxidoreductase [Pirellulaceae bacterium]
MSRRTIQGLRGLVTGASSGIGRELARQLAAAGANLVVTARRRVALDSLVDENRSLSGRMIAIEGDITDARHRERLLAAAHDDLGGLDLLVNNAGVGAIGPFTEAAPERLRRVMEVNFFAPVELIRESLPLLRAGRTPLIVNVSSVLGHRAVPRKSEYCASKFALHGFSDALRAELGADGIDVLLVSPSTTRTEFFDNVLENANGSTASLSAAASAASVAKQTVRAIRRGRHEIILTPGGKLLVWLDRLCPTLADWLVARYSP